MMRTKPTFFFAGAFLLAAMLLAPMAGAEETTRDPHLAKAIELRGQAISAYNSGDYDAAALLARLAKAELALIKTVVPAAKTESAPPVVEVTELPTATPLPASYTVRLIPGDRDCLSKIADYPFVYGDRSKWNIFCLMEWELHLNANAFPGITKHCSDLLSFIIEQEFCRFRIAKFGNDSQRLFDELSLFAMMVR